MGHVHVVMYFPDSEDAPGVAYTIGIFGTQRAAMDAIDWNQVQKPKRIHISAVPINQVLDGLPPDAPVNAVVIGQAGASFVIPQGEMRMQGEVIRAPGNEHLDRKEE